MTKTTIQLDKATKSKLDKRKTPSESYNDAVQRLLEDKGVLFDEAEIRRIARSEVEAAIDDMAHRQL